MLALFSKWETALWSLQLSADFVKHSSSPNYRFPSLRVKWKQYEQRRCCPRMGSCIQRTHTLNQKGHSYPYFRKDINQKKKEIEKLGTVLTELNGSRSYILTFQTWPSESLFPLRYIRFVIYCLDGDAREASGQPETWESRDAPCWWQANLVQEEDPQRDEGNFDQNRHPHHFQLRHSSFIKRA